MHHRYISVCIGADVPYLDVTAQVFSFGSDIQYVKEILLLHKDN